MTCCLVNHYNERQEGWPSPTVYGGIQLTTFAQTTPTPHQHHTNTTTTPHPHHTNTTLFEKSCGVGVVWPHHNFFSKSVVLVWCGCGLGEGCQLYATV